MLTLPDLPVSPYIPQIADTLKKSPSRFLILTAETGAGKSTVIPAGLPHFFDGKILMTEPRRIAALSIAERVSDILDEPCGKTCGYKIHLENRTSKDTKIEVVTEAVLSRTLQNDPSLEGYSVILLDEFHERSLTTDLNLAFLKEAMELRDDLYVIIMSATIETKTLAEYLSSENPETVPLMEIPGRTFPVEVEYKPGTDMVRAIKEELATFPDSTSQTGSQRGQTPSAGFTSRTGTKGAGSTSLQGTKGAGSASLQGTERAAAKGGQTPVILAFLPGIREIRRTENELRESLSSGSQVEIHVLHSSVSLSDQKKIFAPVEPGTARVIISSAIAETSLTVPGVTSVIDSGLSRVNRLNIALGMETLVTESESEFSAEQRKGRAGRTMSGRCVRLWNKNEPRQKSMLPEILRCDITQLILECAAWGKNLLDAERFFLDSPSAAGIKTSAELLQNMQFLDKDLRITSRGRSALEAGVSPRLANLILFAAENPDLSDEAVNLILKYSNYADSKPEMQKRFCDDIRQKIKHARETALNQRGQTPPVSAAALQGTNEFSTTPQGTNKIAGALQGNKGGQTPVKAALLFAGFSDRIAKKVHDSSENGASSAGRISYQFPNGHTAVLAQDLTFSQAPEWLIAPEVLATASGGTIFSWEALSEQEAEALISPLVHEETDCFFNRDNTKISKFVYTKYGKIILSEKRLPVTKEDSALAWCSQIRNKGLETLDMSERTKDFLVRADFYATHSGSTRNVLSRLEENPEEWLTPFLTDGKLTDEVLYNALYWFLDGAEIDRNVPNQLVLPNGKKTKVTYEMNSSPDDRTKLIVRPVIEIIIQRIFGCFESPKVMGQPVLLKLLSPARRPLQITDDLAGFWSGTWIEICKEMKGRYPKHNWDYRVTEKE